jgi:sensor domain CHASE-containing protein
VRRTFTWNVRNRLLVAFLIVAVVPLVVFGALVYARTSSALRDVERQQIVAQARGAREILRDKTRDQSEFIHDYSVWDGFHNALSTGNLAWVRSNVTEWVPANSSTNLVRVFDTAGKSLAAGGDTAPWRHQC